MYNLARKDTDLECDLESGGRASEQDVGSNSLTSVKEEAKTLIDKVYGGFADGSNKGDNVIGVPGNASNCDGAVVEKFEVVTDKKVDAARNLGSAEKKSPKEKHKSTSNTKPTKPPRPPRGPSLDSADQKLIAELAMMKRARNERMKTIKKMKATKAYSCSGNMIAMVFTALFCLVIIFQGVSSRRPASSFQGSPLSAGPSDVALI